MKVSERSMSMMQRITQMQHYWDKLWHLTPDKDKKKIWKGGLVLKISK